VKNVIGALFEFLMYVYSAFYDLCVKKIIRGSYANSLMGRDILATKKKKISISITKTEMIDILELKRFV